jgi:uncharacterized oligopeptide transporter (OPT) family protein
MFKTFIEFICLFQYGPDFFRVRALGETDLNPVSSIAKISQLVFGILQPQNLVANLIAGGISEAGAMQSGELMQDFKTAQLHGVDPASMFYGQVRCTAAPLLLIRETREYRVTLKT